MPHLTPRVLSLILGGLLALPSTVAAQELMAVDFAGQAWAVSPFSGGSSRLIGPTGVTGCNAMAVKDGVYYASAISGVRHQLVTIDQITAQATVRFASLGVDLRGLCDSPNPNELFGVVNDASNADRLVRIHTVTGQVTNVGPTGRSGIQALVRHGGVLFAWDVAAGLLRLNPATGFATDPWFFTGTGGADIQFLASREHGRLLGGNHQIYEIDTDTGTVQQVTPTGTLDLRGGQLRTGRITDFGTGCPAGASGTVMFGFSGALAGNGMTVYSPGHAGNVPGMILMGTGLATTPIGGLPCDQFVVADTTKAITTDFGGSVKAVVQLPPVFGAVVYLQLVTFEPVPGGVVTTQALKVEIPF